MKRSTIWDIIFVLAVLGAASVLFVGCVHVAYEPPLAMPTRPPIRFFMCDTDKVCMTQTDADLFSKWVDKLDAFETGRQRVISGQEPTPK